MKIKNIYFGWHVAYMSVGHTENLQHANSEVKSSESEQQVFSPIESNNTDTPPSPPPQGHPEYRS